MEGFAEGDAGGLSEEAFQIADLVRYRGGTRVEAASSVEVVQLKYSITRADIPMRAADIGKTLKKFAAIERDLTSRAGRSRVEAVVRYEIVTNRPFHLSLITPIRLNSRGEQPAKDETGQSATLERLTGLADASLASFLGRLTLTGRAGSHTDVTASVRRTVADWGTGSDSYAVIRLRALQKLVRDKAGAEGFANNLIDRVEILAALGVSHEDDLYPTRPQFPLLEVTLERRLTDILLREIAESRSPILIHASGGMGKTVAMQALAARLEATPDRVILYDCFGAGQWRDPADQRHTPRRAFLYIANYLAAQGLCDLLLPGENEADLTRSLRKRLIQSAEAIRRFATDARLVLLLDGIDHAALQAEATQESSFAHLLLQTLHYDSLEGVVLVASCRSERRELARGGVPCREFPMPPFSPEETTRLVRLFDPQSTAAEIGELQARSGGNPRILVALIRRGRPYATDVPGAEGDGAVALEHLLQHEVDRAVEHAAERGASILELESFLSGLGLLPPPVPLEELSAAEGQEKSAIDSFVADLFPLIERTPHGLIFRDEPTEKLICDRHSKDLRSRREVVERLTSRQTESVYAARALPHVLISLDLTDQLVELAFSDHLPRNADSQVAQMAIRMARIAAALHVCAKRNRWDDLSRLLFEASRVAVGHERSDRFLLSHPELVANSGDVEALRRLSESRSGWPGARHAALALAYAFTGDMQQARRDAARAIDWINWNARQTDRDASVNPSNQDYYGPAYVEVLDKGDIRVAEWLSNEPPDFALYLFSSLTALVQRHALASNEVKNLATRLARRVARCRLSAKPMISALLWKAALASDIEQTLIRRLAAISTPTVTHAHPREPPEGQGLVDAVLIAAIKATRWGLLPKAREILAATPIEPPSLWQYDSPWFDYHPIERCVLAAAIRGAIARRPPNLLDMAPSEILMRIPERKHRKTPADFEAAVVALLAKPQRRLRRGQGAARVGSKVLDVSEAQRTLQYRVRPLLPLTTAISSLITAKDSAAAVRNALDALDQLVGQAQTYPYRDGNRYAAEVGFNSLLAIVDAADALTDSTATSLAAWLVASPIRKPSIWLRTVACLSRRKHTHEAATSLARRTFDLVRVESDADERISALGSLARAVWLASREEATAYFKQGLDAADAVGSGDFQTAEGLLEVGSHYRGPPLPEESAYVLARICELQIFEIQRFPWLDFGRGMARLGGPMTLAVLARLSRREKTSLGWSVSPLLASLVETGHLDADLATSLVGVDRPVETWHWSLANFAEAVLPKLDDTLRPVLAAFVLDEMDCLYGVAYHQESLQKLSEVFFPYLHPTSPHLARIADLKGALRKQKLEKNQGQSTPQNEEIPTPRGGAEAESRSLFIEKGAIDPGDPEALDRVLAQHKEIAEEHAFRWATTRLLTQLQEELSGVDERLKYLRAVSASKVPRLSSKVDALDEVADRWREISVSVDKELSRVAVQLAERHAPELALSGWEGWAALRQLIALSRGHGSEIVAAAVRSLRERASDVSSEAWLRFAAIMAQDGNADAIYSGFLRYLSKAGPTLPHDLGDGPWSPDLSVPQEQTDLVASLLWSLLGDPDSRVRWRTAHAVRRIVRLKRIDVLPRLFDHFWETSAGAFQDRRFEFHFLHARLWLLISAARIARDEPEHVLPFRNLLESIAFDDAHPHVLMQHFAAAALRHITSQLKEAERNSLAERLQCVNAPSSTSIASQDRVRYNGSRLADEQGDGTKAFHFEYDFAKYDIDSLTWVFDCNRQDVIELCTKWIRQWSPDITHMWQETGSDFSAASDRRDWSRNVPLSRDTWGEHLAWHALMLAAGELLRHRPTIDHGYGEDEWQEWLRRRTLARDDGLWLADGTDPFPSEIREIVGGADGEPPNSLALARLAGLQPGQKLGEEIVVEGTWTTFDHLDIDISAVLVDSVKARYLALAIATEEPFFQALPREADHSGRRFPDDGFVRPLTASFPAPESALDRSDPYGSFKALERPRPAREIAARLGITAADPFGREWHNPNGHVVLRSDAWGTTSGEERREKELSGTRLFVCVEPMLDLLRSENLRLILLIKAQRYLSNEDHRVRAPKRRKRTKGPFITTSIVVTISAEGAVSSVQRIPKTIRSAVLALPYEEQHDLLSRMTLIEELTRNPPAPTSRG